MTREPKPAKGKRRSPASVASAASGKRTASERRQLEQRLAETREQQAATSEILRVIRRSPGDVQPVFDMMAERAMRLCGAVHGGVLTYDGELVHLAAHAHVDPSLAEGLRRAFPRPLDRGTTATRAISTRATVHIPDIAKDGEYAIASAARTAGFRSALAVPILRDGAAIGAITVLGSAPEPFSQAQVELLETFADQAVIAIENARLFAEREARNRELADALDQQIATGQILRVISGTPTDAQPVFDAIAASATQLCDAANSGVFRFDGRLIHLVAHHDWSPEGLAAVQASFPRPPGRGSITARAILSRTVAHEDIATDPEFTEQGIVRAGFRTSLSVPMLRDGQPVGAITVTRMEPRRFSQTQIDLLRTFADQAVIAIENVRLFTEAEDRNRELTDSLTQQTATAEVLRVISGSPTDIQPVFAAVAERAAVLCEAVDAAIFRRDGDRLRLVAHRGPIPFGEVGEYTVPLVRGTILGRAMLDARTVHVDDLQAESVAFPEGSEIARELGHRTTLAVPLLREDAAVGVITVRRDEVRPFTERQIALLETFADQAAIAIENVRLVTELQSTNRALSEAHAQVSEALEQQTATGDILRTISRSPTDVHPVFDTIVRNARRLCGADSAVVYTYDGTMIHIEALDNANPEQTSALRAAYPIPADRGHATGRAILTGRTTHIPDVVADAEYRLHALRDIVGLRSLLSVPMLREGTAIGAITVQRWTTSRPFSDDQIALLETFADQAVIAIENVRLFTELETRNADLRVALEQQTATSEILRVISSSPTDVQPIFEAIAESAARLCDAAFDTVNRFDGELITLAAPYNLAPGVLDILQTRLYPFRPTRDTASGRALIDRTTIHIYDIRTDPEYTPLLQELEGYRTVLAVPMLREGVPIGTITLWRREVRPFSEGQVELIKTFADQAVIAIENVRLFKELETKNRDLTETLAQQTATSEILRVISRSPTDVQPVFDTIVGSAVRLCNGLFSALFRYDGELIHQVAQHNFTPEALEKVRRLYPARPSRAHGSARAILERAVVHIPDVELDPDYRHPELTRAVGFRSALFVPMLRDGDPVGAIMVARAEPGFFSDSEIALLRTFADQAVIAIENVRLFNELNARNAELTDTVARQTATGEVLRAISRAQTDAQPVFDIIAESAQRLCGAGYGQVALYDGTLLHMAAFHNVIPEGVDALRRRFPAPADRGSAMGRALQTRAVVQIPDVVKDEGYAFKGELQTMGFQSLLVVPMLRKDEPIGAIAVGRREPGAFPDKQIELLKTFADQAVIAIENVRLFQELEARTRELTRSVGELEALGEVSQAVSSTLDLETVLATIVSRAVALSGSEQGIVYEFDEATQTFRHRATHDVTPEHVEILRATPIRLGEGAMGRAGVTREPLQIVDMEAESQLLAPQVRPLLARAGLCSLLAVPLVREDRLLGGLVILRRERGAFSPDVVATLQTFATQSTLAIHNAALFREIQRQKQYSEALVEASPVAIVTMDLRGTVVGWNPGAERLFGYTSDEAVGRDVAEVVGTLEMREEVETSLRHALAGERFRTMTRRARKDGSLVDIEVFVVPVFVDGVQMGSIAIYHDITELLQARRDAETANEAKSAFLATMSHEIRTPMNAVIGMSGLLLNTALTDEQREYAEVVRQSGDTLLTVINDILDFSKIEAGRLELESQAFDLRDCVEATLDLVANRAAEKGLDLAYVMNDATPPAIVGDVTRLRQILLNLLSNAVKFTESGEVVLSVIAAPVPDDARRHDITFAVRDTGIGIPPDRLGRLFQSFSQVDASTTRRYGGTGLGLAISQRLTELMGGRITVTSEPGHGSEFRFTIRASASEGPVTVRRDLSGVQPALRDKHVLVVDDNATNRRIVTANLAAWGVVARATGSPAEALAWIRSGEPFDVAIVDMHMPDMDGVTLARAIREHAPVATLPLILFTSLGRREARADSEGFAAYLHKPMKPSQLFDVLVSLFGDHPVHVHARDVARDALDRDMARRHPLRILLAEDNVVNQKLALRLLEQMGYRADVAADGLEAIDAVARQTYDVILMDVQMPTVDGFEASREINRRWPGPHRPRIIAMTANAMQGDRELCIAAGMDDYVAKPIQVDELVAALERSRPRAAAVADDARDAVAERATSPIDRARIDQLVATMGGGFAAELIETFVADGRELVATLRRSLTAMEIDVFRRAAHSLKSTADALGAGTLAARARELESLARSGTLPDAAERLEALAQEYDRAVRALEELRRGLAP